MLTSEVVSVTCFLPTLSSQSFFIFAIRFVGVCTGVYPLSLVVSVLSYSFPICDIELEQLQVTFTTVS